MRKKYFPLIVLMLFFFAVTLVYAQSSSGTKAAAGNSNIQDRIANQQKRINEGVKARKISPDEAKTLQAKLDDIKKEEAAAKADGKFTKEERAKLNQMLDANNKLIQRESGDKEKKAETKKGEAQ